MSRLVKTLLDGWDHLAELPWDELLAEFGDALAPFAALAPAGALPDSPYRQQVVVEALGHQGTLQLLSSWGLPFMLVKGIAWGAYLWGDPLRRPARDLDLVVPAEDLAAWQRRLAAAGFQSERSMLEWVKGRQIVQLHHDGPSPHWLHRVGPPWADFWQRSRLIDVGGVGVRQPDDADLLLYLAHHQVFRHGLDHEIGWLDLAGWLRLPGAATALDQAIERAEGCHLSGSLIVLAWAWQGQWEQTGLETVAGKPSWPVELLCGYLERNPSDPWGQTALSLALAQGEERQQLLSGAWDGFRRWQRHNSTVTD